MAQLKIDLSGRNGLAPRFGGDLDRTIATPELRYLASEGQMVSGVYNPFRRYGYLSPANNTFATVTAESPTAVLKTSSIYDVINNDFYFADDGHILYKGDTLDDLSMDVAVDLGTTGTPTIMDLEIYQVNDIRKLFVVYEKAGYIEIAISNLPYNTTSDDLTWLSTTVTNPLPSQSIINRAFMRVADNGFGYLFMDNQVHKIDGTIDGGTNGTITANALLFPSQFQIVDAIDYRGYIFICLKQNQKSNTTDTASIFNSNAGVYVWNRLTSTSSTADFIPVNGIKNIKRIYVSPTGRLRIIVINSERVAEIREYNGSVFETIEELGYLAFPTCHDSLTNTGYATVWIGTDGYIYSHGRTSFRDNEQVTRIGQFEATNTEVVTGAILYGGGNTSGGGSTGFKNTKNAVYLSYTDSFGSKFFKNWDWHGTGADGIIAKPAQGDVYTPVIFLPQMSTLKNIEIYCFPVSGSGTTAVGTVKFYANQSSTAFMSKTITRDDAAKGYIDINLDKPYINALQIEIEFNTSVAIGANDFAPSFAMLSYTPTNTKG